MTRMIEIIGVGVMFALAVPAVHAQGNAAPNATSLRLNITISATASVQAADVTTSRGDVDTTTSKTVKQKFTTASIISTVEEANSATPTAAAKLVYDNGSITVEDGPNSYDASSVVTINLDPPGHAIWTGTDSLNNNSGDETMKYTGKFVVTLTYDDGNGGTISVAGIATENYSIGKPDANGNQPASDSITMSLFGSGQTSSGVNGILSGTFKATGKGTL
jgi:hypothetical protein